MQILIPFITIIGCSVFNYWFFGGFDQKRQGRLRRANRRNAHHLILLREMGIAWKAYDDERARDRTSPLLPKLKRRWLRARREYMRWPVDWALATP